MSADNNNNNEKKELAAHFLQCHTIDNMFRTVTDEKHPDKSTPVKS